MQEASSFRRAKLAINNNSKVWRVFKLISQMIKRSYSSRSPAGKGLKKSRWSPAALAGWMRLTSEVLSNPQTCGFQIQPQDFSTPLTLQTSSSASSFCANIGIDAEIRARTKKNGALNTHPGRSMTGRTGSFRRCCWRPSRAAAAPRPRPNPRLPT